MTAAPDIPEAAVEAAADALEDCSYRGKQVPPGAARFYARAALAAAAPEIARAAKVAGLREFADLVDSRYPTDVWPELETVTGSRIMGAPSTDRIAASMARAVARQARQEAYDIEAQS